MNNSGSGSGVFDVVEELVGAITTWRQVQCNLLRLRFAARSEDSLNETAASSIRGRLIFSSSPRRAVVRGRRSLSSPDLGVPGALTVPSATSASCPLIRHVAVFVVVVVVACGVCRSHLSDTLVNARSMLDGSARAAAAERRRKASEPAAAFSSLWTRCRSGAGQRQQQQQQQPRADAPSSGSDSSAIVPVGQHGKKERVHSSPGGSSVESQRSLPSTRGALATRAARLKMANHVAQSTSTAVRKISGDARRLLRQALWRKRKRTSPDPGSKLLAEKTPLGQSLSWDPTKTHCVGGRQTAPCLSRPSRRSDDASARSSRRRKKSRLPSNDASGTSSWSRYRSVDDGEPSVAVASGGTNSTNRARRLGSSSSSSSSSQSAIGCYRLQLESACLHCSLSAEFVDRERQIQIEKAVQKLERWTSSDGCVVLAALPQLRRASRMNDRRRSSMVAEWGNQLAAPDIVVSSISSDEERRAGRGGGADSGNSSTRHASDETSSQGSSASISPRLSFTLSGSITTSPSPWENANRSATSTTATATTVLDVVAAADLAGTLLSPHYTTAPTSTVTLASGGGGGGLLSGGSMSPKSNGGSGGGSNEPPRSTSVDLSTLSRQMEMQRLQQLDDIYDTERGGGGGGGYLGGGGGAISSGGETTAADWREPAITPSESIRGGARSRSHDPTAQASHPLRRPSRIEHLSELFRKALLKSSSSSRADGAASPSNDSTSHHQNSSQSRHLNKHRSSRYWIDDYVTPGEHIWLAVSSSSGGGGTATPVEGNTSTGVTTDVTASNTADTECYVGERDCRRTGEKRRCAACHIVAHTDCFPLLAKLHVDCKWTFRPAAGRGGGRGGRSFVECDEQQLSRHHWCHRWRSEGRCAACSRPFPQRLFRNSDSSRLLAVSCSWCKRVLHNQPPCFTVDLLHESCDRGALRQLIVPPTWIERVPVTRRKSRTANSSSSSTSAAAGVSHSPTTTTTTTVTIEDVPHPRRARKRVFLVRRPAMGIHVDRGLCTPLSPLLVFVNPKSGGNKGVKTLNSLCWLLNPRQVFDVTSLRGPLFALEMYRKVATHLRLLVCGGDGTVGWVLSVLDQLNWATYPPMALLPLGTGNDLSRALGWGGSPPDRPLAQLLAGLATAGTTQQTYLDRWRLEVKSLRADEYSSSHDEKTTARPVLVAKAIQADDDSVASSASVTTTTSSQWPVQSELPLTVMNNYFSLGADAHVALQFHHSRSARPQMLNTRLRNRLAYGGLGTIDLFRRSWRDLAEHVTLECDGVDMTGKLRQQRVHCLLFLNIPFYAGGTRPWGAELAQPPHRTPSTCDGLVEVLGFTTASLAALQMGGRGERLAQCRWARIKTTKPIPVQVDGEPCLLAGPSQITLSFHSKVPMLRKVKNKSAVMSTQSCAVQQSISTSTAPSADGTTAAVSPQPSSNMLPPSPVTPTLPFTSLILHVPVLVVGRHDYTVYQDSVQRLKDTAFEVGVVQVEAEMRLVDTRPLVQAMLDSRTLPYRPHPDWRFLDYVSAGSDETTWRVTRQQEYQLSLSDVCAPDDCLLLLDERLPSLTDAASSALCCGGGGGGGGGAATPPAMIVGIGAAASSPTQSNDDSRGRTSQTESRRSWVQPRRVSETLRIVLCADTRETHL